MSPRQTPLTCCLLTEGQAAPSPVGGALPGFPSQVSRERVAWTTGGQAGGLGPPDPRFAAPGLGCQPTPPDRSWLHLGCAHIPLDKSQCHLPSSCPSSWDAVCPWALPPSEAALKTPSSVSLRLCPSLCTRQQSGSGVTHPSRLSWPTVPSFSPRICLPACLVPPYPAAPRGDPCLGCLLLRLAVQEEPEIAASRELDTPSIRTQATTHALPHPHVPGGPALCTCVCASNRCPSTGGDGRYRLGGGGWRLPRRPARRARSPALRAEREGGRAGESAERRG